MAQRWTPQTNACRVYMCGGVLIVEIDGSTPLHWAAFNGHVDAIEMLLENGAILDARGWNFARYSQF